MAHQELEQAVRERYAEEGPDKIAADYGVGVGYVYHIACDLGIRSVNGSARQADTLSSKNRSMNIHYFDTWSANMAWLLGYIWTDGTIRRDGDKVHGVHLVCAPIDEHILHDIRKELAATYPVQRFKPADVFVSVASKKTYRNKGCARLMLSSSVLASCLVDRFGIVPNKSSSDPRMPLIPDEWFSHFARGVIDGDGWFAAKKYTQIGLVGTKRFMTEFQDRLCSTADLRRGSLTRNLKSDKIVSTAWSASADILRLIHFLYPEGDYLHLRRKRESGNQLLSRCCNVKSRPRRIRNINWEWLTAEKYAELKLIHGTQLAIASALQINPNTLYAALARRHLL